jgi:hypothetical protein
LLNGFSSFAPNNYVSCLPGILPSAFYSNNIFNFFQADDFT